MCGISGIVNLVPKRSVSLEQLKYINRKQSHRGPDDEGYYHDHAVGLGHRRLSIIDINSGHQPIFNEDRSIVVVFNGEIYNYRELMNELTHRGHQFRTNSDTEVIVHAWEEWGALCVERFRGMFAFALWDSNAEQLFLARDRLGKKPLHYTVTADGQLIFGSELKVLLAHPDVDTRLREELAEDFLTFGYIPDPNTAYKNIYKLEAGHYLLIDVQRPSISPKQYWDLAYHSDLKLPDPSEHLIQLLSEAIEMRMIADVPLGAFLSGGVDSSAMVALMANLQSAPITTCSIGFSDKKYDESQYASAMADRYNTQHSSYWLRPEDAQDIDQLQSIFDEPFADSSALPTYHVCRLARQHVKVAISGDGGDELFAGYRRQRLINNEERLKHFLPLGLRQTVLAPLAKIYPKADWAPQFLRAKTTLQALAMPSLAEHSVAGYANAMSKLRIDERAQLLSRQYISSLGGYTSHQHLNRHIENAPTDDALKTIQYLDIKTWLAGDILTKVDRTSMANSLEVRAPLLDHKFMEWGFSLSNRHNIRGSHGKYLFKKSLRDYVNHDILYRPKMGFSMPIASWFRGELKEPLRRNLSSSALLDSGYFDPKALQRCFDDHQSRRRDNSVALWSLWIFAQFLAVQ